MTLLRQARRIAGISLLVLFAVASNVILFKNLYLYKRPPSGQDPITLYEKRFEGLRKDLPSKGTIGYISDIPVDQVLSLAHPDAMAAFYLAQYSLAPVTTENGISRPLVLGDFHAAHDIEGALSYYGLTIEKNYGNGVFLFRRKDR